MKILRPESINSFKNLSTDQRINLKMRLYWQAYADGFLDKYTIMEMVCLFLNQHHYVMSGQCAAESRRYRQEVMRCGE